MDKAHTIVYPETKGVLLEDMDQLFGDEPIEDDDDGDDDGDEADDSGSESSLPIARKPSPSPGRRRAPSGIFARLGDSLAGVFGQKRTGARGEYNAVDGEQ